MKKFMLVLFMLAASIATATEIRVPFGPGGLSGQLAESLSASAFNGSWKTTYLGNCKIGESQFRAGTGELYILPLSFTVNGDCRFDITADNVVDIPYSQSLALCYRQQRSELGLKHFLDVDSKKTVMSIHVLAPVVSSWAKNLGLKQARVISDGKAANVLASSFTNEGDYFLLDTTSAIKQTHLTCMFNTGEKDIANFAPAMKKAVPQAKNTVVYQSQMLITPNPALKQKLLSDIAVLKKSPEWKRRVDDPGIVSDPIQDLGKFFSEQQQLLKDINNR
jgi:hypothetical protein